MLWWLLYDDGDEDDDDDGAEDEEGGDANSDGGTYGYFADAVSSGTNTCKIVAWSFFAQDGIFRFCRAGLKCAFIVRRRRAILPILQHVPSSSTLCFRTERCTSARVT